MENKKKETKKHTLQKTNKQTKKKKKKQNQKHKHILNTEKKYCGESFKIQ